MADKKKESSSSWIFDAEEKVSEFYEFAYDRVMKQAVHRRHGERNWHVLKSDMAETRIPHDSGLKLTAANKKTLNDNLVSNALVSREIEIARRPVTIRDGVVLSPIGNKIVRISADSTEEYSGDGDDVMFLEPDGDAGDVDFSGTEQDVINIMDMLSLSNENRSQIIAWWCCALLDQETPIMYLNCDSERGKTVLAMMVAGALDDRAIDNLMDIDASDANEIFAGSRTIVIDNVSKIERKRSDLLCRTVTGGRHMKKKLYKDSDLYTGDIVLPVIMTSMEPFMPIRYDLLTRMTRVEPGLIEKGKKIDGKMMKRKIQGSLPRVRGGLLKIVSRVLGTETDIVDDSRISQFVTNIDRVEKVIPKLSGGVRNHRRRTGDSELESTNPFISGVIAMGDMLENGHSVYDVKYKWKMGDLFSEVDSAYKAESNRQNIRKILVNNKPILKKYGIKFELVKNRGKPALVFTYNPPKDIDEE